MKNRRIVVLISVLFFIIASLLLLKSSPGSAKFIWNMSNGGTVLFPLVSISALIDSINPCAFSILLLTIAFLFSLGTLRSGIIKIGAAYIFGIFFAYLLIGLGILGTLHIFNTPHFMGKLGAFILIAMGIINLLNEFIPKFPIKLQIPHAAHNKMADLMKKSSLPAVFFLGMLVGLCEFPCTGGPYLMVLGLLRDSTTYLKGFFYLIWYNLLFVLPLVGVLFVASDRSILEKLQEWKRNNLNKTRLVGGLIMVVLGVLILMM
ncbi:MAG: hypothetical protein US42_C0012G0014 [Candidatus Magasanikbacteria bacterium GW2011_GWC2_37_14]|uniref:Uncharacterized protein n=1 Tax=Candidatus Magasanikbacteria bacterium GW2011_GWC2_37_14 TaxID=1619046 RepID=A0A0G0G813_9BACT|nr:MAG: hypothetical protein US42_C0012G0014 [Candidatus Magasanikbacteria bacterium GW2011_GWC2_37_14]